MFHLRHRTVAAIALIAAVGGLTGCSASSPSSGAAECAPAKGKVTLTYWSWIPGVDKIVDAFNSTHPNIKVELSNIVGSQAYQDYFNALKAKKGPDLGMIEYDRLPNFKASDYLQDISKCKPVSDLKNKVVPWTYKQVSLGTDAIYATPTDTAPLGLFYRKDIFAKFGLEKPTTWAKYFDDAQKLKAADPSISITSFTPQDVTLLQGLGWQAGAHPYTYTDTAFQLDMTSAPMKKVADYWQNMIDKKLVDTATQPLSPAQYAAWNNGTIATSIGPSWLTYFLMQNSPSTAGKWGVLPLPAWTEGAAGGGNMGGGGTAVFAGTKHPYEAAVFADWLSTDPTANKLIFGAGGTSASAAWSKSDAYDQKIPYFDNEAIYRVFSDSADTTDTSFQWAPDQVNVNNYLQDALSGAFDGSSTITKALTATQSKVVADLKSQSIPVQTK